MNLQPPSGGSCLSPLHFTCSHTDIKGSSNTFQVSVITSPTCIPVCNPETTHTHTHTFPHSSGPHHASHSGLFTILRVKQQFRYLIQTISHKRVFEHFYATCAPNWNCVHIKATVSFFYSSSLSSISFSCPCFSLFLTQVTKVWWIDRLIGAWKGHACGAVHNGARSDGVSVSCWAGSGRSAETANNHPWRCRDKRRGTGKRI